MGCGSAGGNATADEGGTVLWLPSEDLSMLKGPLLLPLPFTVHMEGWQEPVCFPF